MTQVGRITGSTWVLIAVLYVAALASGYISAPIRVPAGTQTLSITQLTVSVSSGNIIGSGQIIVNVSDSSTVSVTLPFDTKTYDFVDTFDFLAPNGALLGSGTLTSIPDPCPGGYGESNKHRSPQLDQAGCP